MSAPDKSNSKAPPSLLSNAGNGADANGSRILANLEGRVEPQADAPRSSRMPLILVVLLVLGVGSWGAWRVQQHAGARPAEAVASGNVAAKTPAATVVASAAAPAALAAASQASAPQAATIISDNSADKDGASTPGAADDNRLSRALANGADEANPASSTKTMAVAGTAEAEKVEPKAGKKSAVAASSSSALASGKSHHEAAQEHGKHELASSKAHPANPKVLAQTKKQEPGTRKRDDADADLLAALVARTEPYDAKSPISGKTSKVSASTRAANAHLAEQVAACGKNGFFEEQLCRWRVCDGHWGKDPSCPQSDSRRP